MAGTTKRVATVVWSISIAVVLLVLTTSVMLPSTKRARISFDEEGAATQGRPAHIPSSKSNNFDFDGQNVLYPSTTQSVANPFESRVRRPATAAKPEEQRDSDSATQPDVAISSSKSGVFRIQSPASTTKPTHIFGSKAAVFDIDKTGILPTDDPATQPSTAPSK